MMQRRIPPRLDTFPPGYPAGPVHPLTLRTMFHRLIDSEQQTADFFRAMVERGVLALEADSKGKRNVKTVAGTAFTTTRPHFEWPADDVLVAFSRERPELCDTVKVTAKPDKDAIKAYIKDTGDTPEGLTVEQRTSVTIR